MCSGDVACPTRRKAVVVVAALVTVILFSAAGFSHHEYGVLHLNVISSSPHRKLLLSSTEVDDPTRIGGDIKVCSDSDLMVNQGPSDPLPSGIPTYTVEITNTCATSCNIARIHIRCGWFSSARLIDPSLFKRVWYNDCLVNEGRPLTTGQTISFQYANTYSYPLSISSMNCL